MVAELDLTRSAEVAKERPIEHHRKMFIYFPMNPCSVSGSMESGPDHFQEILTWDNSLFPVQPGPLDRDVKDLRKDGKAV
jgi:hypothetical protein